MITKDSSLWVDSSVTRFNPTINNVHVGLVREENYNSDLDIFFYKVEVQSRGLRYFLECRQMSRFGDIYNYEEWSPRTQNIKTIMPLPGNWATRVGEVVLVAHLNGSPVDGVILGSLRHPGRKTNIKPKNIAYSSEFNGLETTIDNDGAYKITFKGSPINTPLLKAISGQKIPPPQYNPMSSGSYLTFQKDGSFEISDAGPLSQSIRIDKQGGKTTIASGPVVLNITGSGGKFELECIDSNISAKKSWSISTLQASIEATSTVKIKANKIAIGSGSVELFDTLIKLIEALATLVVSSPVGPCSPIQSAPTWSQIEMIKSKLSLIKGSL
jgi:hypothetical protein